MAMYFRSTLLCKLMLLKNKTIRFRYICINFLYSSNHPTSIWHHFLYLSEGLEKNISLKQRPKESRSFNTPDKYSDKYSDKIDFKIKALKRDKEGHYIMIKRSIQEEDITILYSIFNFH